MAEVSEPDRADISTWRTPITVVLVGLTLLWAWSTQRGSVDGFPTTVLQAEGLLLTALVFSVGFAEQSLRRTLDQSVDEARRRQRIVVEHFTASDSQVSSAQLFKVTIRLAEDAELATTLVDEPRWKAAAFARRYRRLPGLESQRLDHMTALALHRWRPGDSENEADADPELGSRIEIAFNRTDEEWRALKGASGAHGHYVVAGMMRVGSGSAFAALSFAYMYITAMVGLFLLGGVYAGWVWTPRPSIEFWIGLTPILLSITYTYLIKTETGIQLARFASQLESLPLTQLYRTEKILTNRSVTVEQNVNSDSMRALWESDIRWRLDRVEDELFGLSWAQSLRGRMHLGIAIAEGVDHRQSPRWRGNLDRAETYLRLVVARRPDPVALVALARCLEEKGDQFSLEIERLVSAANREIQRIVAAVATAPPAAGTNGVRGLTYGPALATEVLRGQQWLWPTDSRLRESIKGALH